VPDAVIYGKSEAGLDSPDFQILQAVLSAADAAKFGLPARGWALIGNVVQPKSRGGIHLTGSDPADPVQIEANYLSDPNDPKAALACVELCREIGNSSALRPFVSREIIPDNLERPKLENTSATQRLAFGINRPPPKWAGMPCVWWMASSKSTVSTTFA
jgi:choline dehydrogenase